jgi:hypothetical protein
LQELSDHPIATIDSISAMQTDIEFIELDNSKRKLKAYQENRDQSPDRDQKDVKNDQKNRHFYENSDTEIEELPFQKSEIFIERNEEMNNIVGDRRR